MVMLFQNLELLRIEDLACIILQSRKASSSLAHVTLSIFIKLLAKYYTYHSCMKNKNTIFITMNMTMWWAMEPWFELMVEVPLQWVYIYLGLTTNVVQ